MERKLVITNTAKQRMQQGKVALGVSCGLGVPFPAEMVAQMGFDWVMIDNQHGSWDRYSSMLAFMAVRAGGSIPMARALVNRYDEIGRLLDEGALGIIVPMVDTVEQAEAAAFACTLPASRWALQRRGRRQRLRCGLHRELQRPGLRGDPAGVAGSH